MNDLFFAPTYSDLAVALTAYEIGDMNRIGGVEPTDVMAFAMAIQDPDGYFEAYEIEGEDSGDINGVGGFNFDDIEAFSELDGINLTAEEIFAVIQAYGAVVPEPTTGLFSLVGSIVILASSGRRSRLICPIAA